MCPWIAILSGGMKEVCLRKQLVRPSDWRGRSKHVSAIDIQRFRGKATQKVSLKCLFSLLLLSQELLIELRLTRLSSSRQDDPG